ASPSILIERLNDVVRLGQRLAQAERKDDLAIGEVTEHLARAPFALGRSIDAIAGVVQKVVEARWCLTDHFERISIAEEGSVGVGDGWARRWAHRSTSWPKSRTQTRSGCAPAAARSRSIGSCSGSRLNSKVR